MLRVAKQCCAAIHPRVRGGLASVCVCSCVCVLCIADAAHAEPPVDTDDTDVFEITVHADDPDIEDVRARTTLDADDLERQAGDDLADTLAGVAGVRTAGGTADASKPIIRGQQERRLLVLNDGVRHESQKWGPDHATEVDPFSAGQISVIRGAAGARYGPDAIGGVILVQPPPLRTQVGVGGLALASFDSNGRRPYVAARVDAVPAAAPDLSVRLHANVGVGANRSATDYVLGNTASRTYNLGATLGYTWDAGRVRAAWTHHAFAAGIFYGVQNGTPTDFASQLDAERPATADLWSTTYAIDRPSQSVTHDMGLLNVDLFGGWGSLDLTYAFQLNHRQEFEQVREGVSGSQYDFTLRTHSIDALYRHSVVSLPFGELDGGMGVQGTFQENVYRGYALLPNYRSFGGGVFAYERLSLARVDIEAGARLDGLARVAFLGDDDYQRHIRRGTLDDTVCDETAEHARCPAAYSAGSLSIGALVHLVPDRWDVKVDLSRASRFPNVDELYLIGTAPSFPVYGLGSPGLGVETAWGATITTGVRHPLFETELSAYGQYIQDYIYFAPDLNSSGLPRFDVTIRGTWPRFTYQPVNAVVYGMDGTLSAGPTTPIGLDVRAAVVRAQDAANGDQLIGTPPDQLTVSTVGRLPAAGPFDHSELRATVEAVARQSRTDDSVDFAPAPPGFALLGLSAETTLGAKKPIRIGVAVHNLLNTAYRDYTSLLRYYADQPGRNIRVRVGVPF